MKKFLTIGLLICFMLLGSFTLVGCNSSKHSDLNLTISNYESYTSLSVGTVNNSTMRTNAMTSASNKDHKKTYLLGKDEEGHLRKIDFEEDKTFTESYNVVAVKDLGNFLILLYSSHYVDNIAQEINSYSLSDYFFALYKPTGKMYDITKYQVNVYTMGVYSATDNSFYSIIRKNQDTIICQFSVENNILQVKERFNTSLVLDFGATFMADKYGNIFSTHNGASYVSRYIITANDKIKKLDVKVDIAINGIAYTKNGYFNENGDLIYTDRIPSLKNPYFVNKSYVGNKFLIYTNDNASYFRQVNNSSYDMPGEIIKCEFHSDNTFTITSIQMEKFEKNSGIVIKDRIYFLNGSEIYYINITDGSYTSITSEYIFNKMYTDNQDTIIFEAVNEDMDLIVGTISYDGNISIGVQEKEYAVEYVFPLF